MRLARERSGLTQEQVGERFKITRNAVSLWESGKNVPGTRRIAILQTLFRLPAGWLMDDTQNSLPDAADSPSDSGDNARRVPPFTFNPAAATELPGGAKKLPRDIEIRGTAMGAAMNSFALLGVVDLAERHLGITDLKNVWAIRCPDDTMAPWRKPDELVYFTSSRPPVLLCHVVVELKPQGDRRPDAYLGLLVARSGKEITLRHYKGNLDFTVDTKLVHDVYRVLEWPELLL